MEQPDQFVRDGAEFLLLAFEPGEKMREFASRHARVRRDIERWNLMGGVHFGLSCANALFDV
jgi:hypothetical protein